MIHQLVLLNLLRLLLAASVAGLVSPPVASAAISSLQRLAIPLTGTLNLNAATAQQLQLLPGVGPTTAAKIIAYRERRPFRSIRQLMRIKGIGPKRFEQMRPYITVDGETTLRPAGPELS